MNEEEKRFHAAVAAMQGILSHPPHYLPDDFDGKDVAGLAREYADALLAELDRTADHSVDANKMVPDADGWIPHDGGEQPCPDDTLILRKYRSGAIYNDPAPAGDYYWGHDFASCDIIAWKPANP